MRLKIFSVLVILVLMLVCLTGCSNDTKTTETTDSELTSKNEVILQTSENKIDNEVSKSSTRVVDTINYEAAAEKQLAKPEKGETVAIINVKNYGEIKVKFLKGIESLSSKLSSLISATFVRIDAGVALSVTLHSI